MFISFYVYFQVKVTQKPPNSNDEKFIRTLTKGDFFGEKALQGYVFDLKINAIANSETQCVVLDNIRAIEMDYGIPCI